MGDQNDHSFATDPSNRNTATCVPSSTFPQIQNGMVWILLAQLHYIGLDSERFDEAKGNLNGASSILLSLI